MFPLKQRIKTGAVIVLAVCLVLRFSHVSWVMNSALAFLCVTGVYELYDAIGLTRRKGLLSLSCLAAVGVALVPMPHYGIVLAVLLPVMMVLFGLVMARIGTLQCIRPWQIMALAGAVVLCFASIKQIRLRPLGLYELTLGLFVCMVTDSFAYLVGRKFGRRKLAPKVSPGKSVEGSIGGSVATVILLTAACALLEAIGGPKVNYGEMVVYLLIASVIGQYGDLCMSAIKRVVGIKDYGNLLPGHGGILDRCDSLMLVLPFTYLFCSVVGPIFG